MAATVEYYEDVIEALHDFEGLTVVVAAGATRDSVAEALSIDLTGPRADSDDIDDELTAWALADVAGGVIAIEWSGYGDPSLASLRQLTQAGGAAAVVRNNVQAHVRFGCARDGEILFDEDEYIYDGDPDEVPTELRALFDLVYDDLEDEDDDAPDPVVVGLAMAEVVTGIELTAEDLARVMSSRFYSAPSLVYPDKA